MIGVPAQTSFGQQVVEATGLAGMLAEGAVRRCCRRMRIDMDLMRPRDLQRLLPELEPVLRVYLNGPEIFSALDRLQRLAEGDEHTEPFGRKRDAE